jgi:hypothetical protein
MQYTNQNQFPKEEQMRGIVSILFLEVAVMLLVVSVLMLPKKEYILSPLGIIIRGIFWLPTILSWIIQKKLDELGRLFRNLWPFLSTFWFWKWAFDQIARLHLQPKTAAIVYLVTIYVIMAFLTLCIEIWRYSEKSLTLRVLFWPITIPAWFIQTKHWILIAFGAMIWAMVALSWFCGICLDLGGLFYDIFTLLL